MRGGGSIKGGGEVDDLGQSDADGYEVGTGCNGARDKWGEQGKRNRGNDVVNGVSRRQMRWHWRQAYHQVEGM